MPFFLRLFLGISLVILQALETLSAQPVSDDTTLSLDLCVRAALGNSPGQIRNRGDLESAEAERRARVAPVLPQVAASAGYARNSSPYSAALASQLAPLLGPSLAEPSNAYTATVAVSQSLVDVAAWRDLARAGHSRQGAAWSFQDASAALAFQVKDAYYRVVRTALSLQVSRAAVAQGEEQAKVARGMAQLGSLGRTELLKVEVGLSQARLRALSGETQALAARQALGLLLGLRRPVAAETSLDVSPAPALPPEDSLVAQALRYNPGYLAAEAALSAARAGLDAARYRALPTLAGSWDYGYSDARRSATPGSWSDHDYWSVGVNLNWNVFDGGRVWAEASRAAAAARSADAAAFQARQGVVNELRQALGDLRAAEEGLRLSAQLLPQAEEAYRLAARKFALGSASALDLLNSQVSYNEAMEQNTGVRCDYLMTLARIQRILGKW